MQRAPVVRVFAGTSVAIGLSVACLAIGMIFSSTVAIIYLAQTGSLARESARTCAALHDPASGAIVVQGYVYVVEYSGSQFNMSWDFSYASAVESDTLVEPLEVHAARACCWEGYDPASDPVVVLGTTLRGSALVSNAVARAAAMGDAVPAVYLKGSFTGVNGGDPLYGTFAFC